MQLVIQVLPVWLPSVLLLLEKRNNFTQLIQIQWDWLGFLFTGVGFLRINLAVDGTNRGFVAALALLTAF